MEYEIHHPFCNYHGTPIENCKFCPKYYEKYPIKDGSEDLIKTYFPNVKIRKN